jgi:hypothetical protein
VTAGGRWASTRGDTPADAITTNAAAIAHEAIGRAKIIIPPTAFYRQPVSANAKTHNTAKPTPAIRKEVRDARLDRPNKARIR